ncbi:hypothetical protein EDD15DRAFT_2367885 [Pisolithus albus]|nr:hypothetical protein EDD15DRAFT_2367885 [Pisolithus albus]
MERVFELTVDQLDLESASYGRGPKSGLDEALRIAQLQLDVERTCNRELKERNMILEANKPKQAKKDVPPELLAYESEIKTLAKKYGVITELFFPRTPTTDAISQAHPVSAPPFSTADRYATVLTEELCLVAELDASLPDHLCRIRNTNSFHDMFSQAMQSGRSDILYKLWDNVEEIFGLPKAHFTPSFARLEIPEIVQMLGVKNVGTPNQKFTMWFPFLFKNMRVDMRKPFMNWEPLGQILKAALWGKMSLAKGFVRRGGPKTNGRKWQVSAVTPGAIAWAATIVGGL